MIASILDNDLYKFSMGYAYMKLYPDAEGKFEFNDRNKLVFTDFMVERLKEEFAKLSSLPLTDDEKNWASSNPILKTGELAIVKTASNNIKMKVGDGI